MQTQIVAKIRKLRNEKGLNQQQMADRLHKDEQISLLMRLLEMKLK